MTARSTMPAGSRSSGPLLIADPAGGTGQYVPGVCNIGRAEIARRRAFGHLGLAVTVVLLGLPVAVHAPAWTRLILFVTAGGSASGYLQARLRFCANFGSRGVYNFDHLGTENRVASAEDRARDRRRSLEIGLASGAIGLVVAVAAFFLPL